MAAGHTVSPVRKERYSPAFSLLLTWGLHPHSGQLPPQVNLSGNALVDISTPEFLRWS